MSEPTEHDIRTRAHQLWEISGQPEGREQDFWLEAERELNGKSPTMKTEENSDTFLE